MNNRELDQETLSYPFLYGRFEVRREPVPLSVVHLLTDLLVFCRDRQETYYPALNYDPGTQWAEKLKSRVEALARAIGDPRWWQDDLSKLEAVIAEAYGWHLPEFDGDGRHVLAARSIAEGIESTLGHRFYGEFRRLIRRGAVQPIEPGRVRLGPRDLVPTALPKRSKDEFSDLAFYPQSTNDYVDRLVHVRLFPDNLPFTVYLDHRFEDALSEIAHSSHQLLAVGDLGPLDDADYEIQQTPTLLGPVSRRGDGSRLQTIFRQAESAGATVLVYPELCARAEDVNWVKDELAKSTSNLRLVVAGSIHFWNESGYRNRAYIFVRTAHTQVEYRVIEAHHDKFARFQYGDRTENIERSREIAVYVSSGTTFAFLVCKDFLQHSALDLIRALGVRNLYVVAMSRQTAEFEVHLHDFSVVNSGIGVVACTSPVNQPSAIFAAPRRAHNPQSVVTGGPCLVLYDLSSAATSSRPSVNN